jgi:hypothetical protein
MATALSKLSIVISANASGLSTDISRALDKAHGQMLRGGKMIGTALAAGVAAGVATLGTALQRGIKQIDDLSAAASKLGTTTSGLAALEHAAKLADTSFEGLTSGIQKLQANLAMVSAGKGGAATGALNFLKLDAIELRKLKPEDQIFKIAEAFGRITDQSARMAAMKGLFGKGGAELINLLKLGAEGIRDAFEEAQILGLRIGEGSAESVGRLDNATVRLRAAWDGFSRQLAAQVAPLLEGLGTTIVQIIKDMGGMEAIVRRLVEGFVKAAVFAADIAQSFVLANQHVVVWTLKLREANETMRVGMQGLKVAWDDLQTAMVHGLKVAFVNLTNEAIAIINRVKVEAGTIINIGRTTAGLPPTQIGVTAPLDVPELPTGAGGTIDTSLLTQTTGEVEEAEEALADLKASAGESGWGDQIAENFNKATAAITNTTTQAEEKLMDVSALAEDGSKKAAKRVKKSTKEMEDSFQDVHDRNRELVLDMTMAWITGTGKWSDIISQWAQQTLKTFLSVMLFGRQIQTVGAGGVIGTQNVGGLLQGLGTFAVNLFGGVKQHGGSVGGGIAYKVGEVGPEMFVPHDAGTVIPNRMMRGGGGGMMQPIIVNQQFAPGVQQSHIAVMLDQLRAESKAGVLAAVEEGGTFRRRLRA